MMIAAEKDDFEIVFLLIKKGANMNIQKKVRRLFYLSLSIMSPNIR
jgi:hypothetical protein